MSAVLAGGERPYLWALPSHPDGEAGDTPTLHHTQHTTASKRVEDGMGRRVEKAWGRGHGEEGRRGHGEEGWRAWGGGMERVWGGGMEKAWEGGMERAWGGGMDGMGRRDGRHGEEGWRAWGGGMEGMGRRDGDSGGGYCTYTLHMGVVLLPHWGS